MADLIVWGITFLLFALSYFVGTRREQAHFVQIVEREQAHMLLPAVSFKNAEDRPIARTKLVRGSVVVAGDFFKQVVAQLCSIFGLRITVAEGMIDRGRREAILRMKEQASGADVILNVRVSSTKVGERENINGLEMLAYGTAVYYVK